METNRKCICFLAFVVVILNITTNKLDGVEAYGECGRYTSPDREAFKMIPCMSASKDPYVEVSERCCSQVKKLGQNPGCLCAVMLSNTAKNSGAKPEVSITIPKRCDLVDRPVGYQCGGYTLP